MTRKTSNHASNKRTIPNLKSEVYFYDNDDTKSNLSVTYMFVIGFFLENYFATNILRHTATHRGHRSLNLIRESWKKNQYHGL